MNKRFDQILDLVFSNIENSEINMVKDGSVKSQYNGYIASFGANIIRIGLQAAVVLFENESAETEADRTALTKLIRIVLIELYKKEKIDLVSEDSLIAFIRKNTKILSDSGIDIRKDIEQVATAIKLVIRTYMLEEN